MTAHKATLRLYQALMLGLPWSLECSLGHYGQVNLLTEPVLGLLTLIVWKEIYLKINPPRFIPKYKAEEGKGGYTNKTSAGISVCFLLWMFVSALFSTIPLVSLKYVLVEFAHWSVFFLGTLLFPRTVQRAFPLFVSSLSLFVLYALIRHAGFQFRADQALLAPMPFFPEHNLYAATLVATLWLYGRFDFKTLLLFCGILLATSRMAWVTMGLTILAFGSMANEGRLASIDPKNVVVKIVLGIQTEMRKRLGLALLIIFFLGSYVFRGKISHSIQRDVSLMERFNRYSCAIRMAADKPWTGFGPGTFQFKYFLYQQPEEKTRISLDEPLTDRSIHNFGRGGGAHSEYCQTLSEQGFPGLILLLLLLGTAFYYGFPFVTAFGALLTLSSLVLHYTLNNFSHDARISMLFWIAIAWLTHPCMIRRSET